MKTTKLLSLSLILFLLAFQSNSQTKQDSSVNSLRKGSWSIQFGIGNNLNVAAFNNYSISLKTHLTSKCAIRLGVGGSVSNQSGPLTDQGYSGNYSNKDYEFQFEVIFMYYFAPKSTLNFFAGAGPVGTYSYTEENRPEGDGNYYNKSTSWGLGAKALAGCEWFFMRKISLFAEYEAFITFGKTHNDDQQVFYNDGNSYITSSDSKNIFLRANSARLGLSAYF